MSMTIKMKENPKTCSLTLNQNKCYKENLDLSLF